MVSLIVLAVVIVFFSRSSVQGTAQDRDQALEIAEMAMQTALGSVSVCWPEIKPVAKTAYRKGFLWAEVHLLLPDSVVQIKAFGQMNESERRIEGTIKPVFRPDGKQDWQRIRWEIF